MWGTRTRILKKYNRRRSKRYSKKSKRYTRKNVYSKKYKKIQKGGIFCDKEIRQLQECNLKNTELGNNLDILKKQLNATETELTASKRQLNARETELSRLKSALVDLSNQNIKLQEKSNDDVKSSPEYLKMKENVILYEEGNKKLTDEVKKLQNQNFELSMQLKKLTNQKMPTDEEIDAVSLDDNDNKEIDKILDEWYSSYTNIDGHSKGMMPERDTPIINIKEYKSQNKERAIREYKKIKLMKEHSGS